MYPHVRDVVVYTIGWYCPDTCEWYFNGEFEDYADAKRAGQNTANAKGRRARVTNHKTGHIDYFEPQTA